MNQPKVVSINGAAIESDQRSAFVQAVAASFDSYIEANGCEPDAIVYVMAGVKQRSRIAWHVAGESEGAPMTILAIAASHCQAEVSARRQGLG